MSKYTVAYIFIVLGVNTANAQEVALHSLRPSISVKCGTREQITF